MWDSWSCLLRVLALRAHLSSLGEAAALIFFWSSSPRPHNSGWTMALRTSLQPSLMTVFSYVESWRWSRTFMCTKYWISCVGLWWPLVRHTQRPVLFARLNGPRVPKEASNSGYGFQGVRLCAHARFQAGSVAVWAGGRVIWRLVGIFAFFCIFGAQYVLPMRSPGWEISGTSCRHTDYKIVRFWRTKAEVFVSSYGTENGFFKQELFLALVDIKP